MVRRPRLDASYDELARPSRTRQRFRSIWHYVQARSPCYAERQGVPARSQNWARVSVSDTVAHTQHDDTTSHLQLGSCRFERPAHGIDD